MNYINSKYLEINTKLKKHFKSLITTIIILNINQTYLRFAVSFIKAWVTLSALQKYNKLNLVTKLTLSLFIIIKIGFGIHDLKYTIQNYGFINFCWSKL